MLMLYIIFALFILAGICPIILPNHKVSNHKRDHI